ncbi:MAG: hypothetical protein A4E35_00429 [Methanoregula sp. PtaU1.Bin051]|nr:MAG: hypothetical protein A4E35_00429 [Methanoregula sp. PtaU1.Bin051]
MPSKILPAEREAKKWLRRIQKTIDPNIPLMIQYCDDDGLHNVVRTIVAYIEIFGAAYKNHATSSQARIDFIRDFFDPKYRDVATIFYTIFRHGPIHTLKPERSWYKGHRLGWLVQKSQRATFFGPDGREYTHLQLVKIHPQGKPTGICFPISVNLLYRDLKGAINKYFYYWNSDPKLRSNAALMVEKIQTGIEITCEPSGGQVWDLFPKKDKRTYKPTIPKNELQLLDQILTTQPVQKSKRKKRKPIDK